MMLSGMVRQTEYSPFFRSHRMELLESCPEMKLRNSKNMFIAGITLFTRAAIEGGVPEETAYALSDGYIQTVEECTSKSSIEKLLQKQPEICPGSAKVRNETLQQRN